MRWPKRMLRRSNSQASRSNYFRLQADKFLGSHSVIAAQAAENVEDLRVPPGNKLERLKGNRKGQYSVRINDQWRICFKWSNGNATDVEIVDYHKG